MHDPMFAVKRSRADRHPRTQRGVHRMHAQADALARSQLPSTSFDSPSASPASQRPQRKNAGVKGKPSPPSADKMPPPPKPKEPPAARRVRREEAARQAMLSDAANFPQLSTERSRPGPPLLGLTQQLILAPQRVPQQRAAPATPQRPSAWGQSAAAAPNLVAAASSASAMLVTAAYASPLTGGAAAPSAAAPPRVTRNAAAAAAAKAAAEAAAEAATLHSFRLYIHTSHAHRSTFEDMHDLAESELLHAHGA